jgi:hypothetical protein
MNDRSAALRYRRLDVRIVPNLAIGVLDSIQAATPRLTPPSRARRLAVQVYIAAAAIALSLFALALASNTWS